MPIPSSPVLLKPRIELPERTLGKDQPQYLPLISLVSSDKTGLVTSRWQLTWRERFKVFFHGNVWVQLMMFHRPYYPTKLTIDEPDVTDCL